MRLAAALCCVSLAAAGCFDVDVGGAAIACDDDVDCPSPLFCDGDLCQKGGAAIAPGVITDTFLLTGSPARPGGAVEVVFSATRALGAAPDFVIDDVAFVLDADSAGADVRASGTVAATARDGERDLAVILVDDAGNTSDALALGSVVVHGTGPELASVDAPSTVASDSELLVRMRPSRFWAKSAVNFL